MYMDLRRLLTMVLVTTPRAVVLLVCIGVGGYLCPIICNAWRDGIAYRQLTKRAPSSASTAEDMTALMIWKIVMKAPLFDRMAALSDMKKWPPALLLAFVSERYEAFLWADITIPEAQYVIIA